jgi:lysophospholipase L1-like esterase
VRVLNRGIGGEEEADMLARFERDVIAARPDLVLWQVASNAIIRHRPQSAELMLIRKGIARLKRTGADVILVDPQYTKAVLAQSIAVPLVELISAEARRQHVGVFKRFELMKDWHENQHLPFEAFSVPDGLHMNDWGYDCLARNLAAAITASVMPAEWHRHRSNGDRRLIPSSLTSPRNNSSGQATLSNHLQLLRSQYLRTDKLVVADT